jgi:hypothetical protein
MFRRCSSEKPNLSTRRRASAGSSFSTAASRCSRSGVGCASWRRSQRSRLTWAASTAIWAVTGSNRRHPACKAGALPAELTALPANRSAAWHDPPVSYPSAAERRVVAKRLRSICLALPEVSERLSHGAPSFFVREKRCFLMLFDDHHGDGRFAIWCAAPEGDQQLLVGADEQRFFSALRRPPRLARRPPQRRCRLGRARRDRRGRVLRGRTSEARGAAQRVAERASSIAPSTPALSPNPGGTTNASRLPSSSATAM